MISLEKIYDKAMSLITKFLKILFICIVLLNLSSNLHASIFKFKFEDLEKAQKLYQLILQAHKILDI